MRIAKLLEEIKRDSHILRRAEHWIAKGDVNQSLAEFVPRNPCAGIAWPNERVRIRELRFALIQLEINMLTEKIDDFRIRCLKL